jgi:eukaryotic translation initiation factor 2C
MVNGGKVKSWICINFTHNEEDSVVHEFCHQLAVVCQASGMASILEMLPSKLAYCRKGGASRSLCKSINMNIRICTSSTDL